MGIADLLERKRASKKAVISDEVVCFLCSGKKILTKECWTLNVIPHKNSQCHMHRCRYAFCRKCISFGDVKGHEKECLADGEKSSDLCEFHEVNDRPKFAKNGSIIYEPPVQWQKKKEELTEQGLCDDLENIDGLPDEERYRGRQIMWIDIDLVDPYKDQPRKFFKQASIIRLARSIKKKGQQKPIDVEAKPDGRFNLKDGERRYWGTRLAKLKKILAVIHDPAAEKERFSFSFFANHGSEECSDLDSARGLKRMMEEFKMSAEEIADGCVKTPEWVYQRISILRHPEEIQKMMDPSLPEDKQLTYSSALHLLKIPDNEDRIKLAQKIVSKGIKTTAVGFIVRKEMKRLGIKDKNRTPRNDYRALRSLLNRTENALELFVDIPREEFAKIFKFRVMKDRNDTMKSMERIEKYIDDLKKRI